jgi:hypothetical protein
MAANTTEAEYTKEFHINSGELSRNGVNRGLKYDIINKTANTRYL